ncbi:class I SAM-dependent methyltransferase [Streptomyces sp. MBT65]|nr:cyclopropane-fatty-acyl-phospholipid synthase family protein [Streptomyces sp. MBT65]MBK3580341.1 class I SAM-dependent methyltransferase [Streptomyces sp. MBT65]
MTTPTPTTSPATMTDAPSAPVRARMVELLFRRAMGSLPVRVAFPGGERIGRGGTDSPVMRIVRPAAFFSRLAVVGPVGFGESYMAGDWTSTDPAGLLTPVAARLTRPARRPATAFRRWADQTRPDAERNTLEGARSNIRRHYDLSNEFFALFLDRSMTYSCALFGPGDDLHTAQLRKIDRVLDLAGVGPGTRMLEIGTGWGALAVRAGQRGAEVTTLTLSPSQRDLARARIAEAGLADRVTVLLRDYREAEGAYDAIVSVEMLEAVGAEYWPAYFAVLDRLLAPGGQVALQTITMPHDRMLATKDVRTWIQKYVFPGGQIPSLRALEEALAPTSLRVGGRHRMGDHYARTLAEWRSRFLSRDSRDEVASIGFPQVFPRLWDFYLAYSEAGFRSGYLDLWQLRLIR